MRRFQWNNSFRPKYRYDKGWTKDYNGGVVLINPKSNPKIKFDFSDI